MSSVKLSEGDIRAIFTNVEKYHNPAGGIFQCHRTRKNDPSVQANRKNLIVISDGVTRVKALLRNEAVKKAREMEMNVGDIFQMTRGEPAIVQEKKKYIVLIDDIELLERGAEIRSPGCDLIDSYLNAHPEEVVSLEESAHPPAHAPPQQQQQQQQQQYQKPPQYAPQQQQYNGGRGGSVQQSSSQKSRPIFAIEQLSPYQNMWTIKARVSFKGDIKTWSNQKGDGKLFNVNLLDTSGEIRATAFNDNAVKYYEMLQEGRVYYVSKARIQPSKPQFSNLSHPYELQLDRDTVIEECYDEVDVPKMNFSFVKVNAVETLEPNSTVDILGIIQAVNPPFEITSKAGKKFDRRDIVLVDDSNYSVTVGLWGKQALDFNLPEGSVLAIKGGRITDFNGKGMSIGFNSTMHPNPEVPEAYALKGWYDSAGRGLQYHSLKQEPSAGGGNKAKFIAERITIAKAQAQNLGMSEKGDYFNIKAAVNFLKVDNFAYSACANEGCNKKVIQSSDGTWRCEKCDANHDKPQWRYMLTISVLDETGQLWMTLFNEQAELLLGTDAGTLMDLKENDADEFTKATQKIQMYQFDFRVRAREDNYNEQTRIRYSAANVHSLNYKAEADFLAEELGKTFLI
ncbi:LANO_0F07074g1_1 [Lachancea nothofagi CBS 11611]|uniref:Replication protein A subunit n=1 Tax=Lachancea nothofagi CBS 11611 TaxID=1266666 RepID=A0A1G4K8U1_9SACH|nr:LANO_0F07074g1_1 [Lachancea nothofagi CBS 11611]